MSICYEHLKNWGGFDGIWTYDLCEVGAMLHKLWATCIEYKATQLGEGQEY